ncbi:MAG: tetratricopeptide repeat protein [Bryobacteraceae bacterium]
MRRAPGIFLLLPGIVLAGLACGECFAQFLPITSATSNEERTVAPLIAQARASLQLGDLERERTILEQVLTLVPTHKQARLALIEAFMRLERWNEAENQARVLLTQYPADTEPVFLLSMIAMRRGDPEMAKKMANRCLEHGDARPEVYKVLALSEYLLQDTSQFEANIRTVLRKNPQDAEAQYFLARYLFEIKRYSESLNLFQVVVNLQPDHYKAHYYIGLLQVASGEADLARAEFETSIKIIDTKKIAYAWPFAELGRALNDAGETEEAIEWLSRGIRNDPACPRNYYEYARALFQKGATSEVKNALLEAVRLDPGYTEAYYLLARYYRKSGESQTATQVLARFRDLKSHPIPSPYGLPRQ